MFEPKGRLGLTRLWDLWASLSSRSAEWLLGLLWLQATCTLEVRQQVPRTFPCTLFCSHVATGQLEEDPLPSSNSAVLFRTLEAISPCFKPALLLAAPRCLFSVWGRTLPALCSFEQERRGRQSVVDPHSWLRLQPTHFSGILSLAHCSCGPRSREGHCFSLLIKTL